MKTAGLNNSYMSNEGYSPNNQSLGNVMLSQNAIRAIRKKMEIVAKELSDDGEIGLDE